MSDYVLQAECILRKYGSSHGSNDDVWYYLIHSTANIVNNRGNVSEIRNFFRSLLSFKPLWDIEPLLDKYMRQRTLKLLDMWKASKSCPSIFAFSEVIDNWKVINMLIAEEICYLIISLLELPLGGERIDAAGSRDDNVDVKPRSSIVSYGIGEGSSNQLPIHRGFLIFLNNFDYQGALSFRAGHRADCESLQQTAKILGLVFKNYENLSADRCRDVLPNEAFLCSKSEFLFVVACGHGFRDPKTNVDFMACPISQEPYIDSCKRKYPCTEAYSKIELEELISIFSDPQLKHMKIVILLNCCREFLENTHESEQPGTKDRLHFPALKNGYSTRENVIVVFAACPGNLAYRHNRNGSFLVQDFCAMFLQKSKVTSSHLRSKLAERLHNRVNQEEFSSLELQPMYFVEQCIGSNSEEIVLYDPSQ